MKRSRRLGSFLIVCFAFGLALHGLDSLAPPPHVLTAHAEVDTTFHAEVSVNAGMQEVEEHSDPFSPILLELACIILAAVLGRWAAGKLHMAPVLGELLIGVLVGNIGYQLGISLFVIIMHLDSAMKLFGLLWTSGVSIAEAAPLIFSPEELAPDGVGHRFLSFFSQRGAGQLASMSYAVWLFSNLGVILLLFMVGLESSVDEMMRVGPKALIVACVGVVVPFALGFLLSSVLIAEASPQVHLFLGATLSATSVGITARVFRDLRRVHTAEAKVILGAAVIDDVLGLIILAVVIGIVTTGALDILSVGKITLTSVAFLGLVMLFGERALHWLISKTSRFETGSIKLLYPLSLAFIMAWLSNLIGLAPIVGAFAAGLLLKDEFFQNESGNDETIGKLVAPLERIFAPVFFVLMGMQVNLQTFLDPETLWLALAFIAAAIGGKVVSGFSIRGLDRLTVGIGMVPRGEVGLIFASIGKGLGVVTGGEFSAIVMMVIVTTLITPLALKWSLARRKSQ